jgi:hypothetical protein
LSSFFSAATHCFFGLPLPSAVHSDAGVARPFADTAADAPLMPAEAVTFA